MAAQYGAEIFCSHSMPDCDALAQGARVVSVEPDAIQDTYDDVSSWCYGCGRLNEGGLHFRTFVEGEETVTRYVPGAHYTGGRDFLYGGLIASIIDCHSTATAAAAGYAAGGRAFGSRAGFAT